MHPASRSVKYFGLYVVLTGGGLLFVPNLVFALLGVPAPTEVWVRVLGALAIGVGYYYWACGSSDVVVFFRASIRGRVLFALLLVLIVVLFNAPAQLVLFAVIDVLGAAWTAQGVRLAARQGTSVTAREA